MAEITAALVKRLRDQTGAGMMDCKAALRESGGDLETATDWLRKKGLAAAAKKAGRLTSEGLIGVRVEHRRGAMVEINSETDFVARNEEFQNLVRAITAIASAAGGDVDALLQLKLPGSGRSVADEITQAISVIGENINLRRTATIDVTEGIVGSYVHGALAPGLGKIGVLVGLQSAADSEQLAAFGKQLAMHIAAARPQAVSVDRLDPAVVQRERAIYADQARAAGKPDSIVDKIVDGRHAQVPRGGGAARAALRDRSGSQDQGRDRSAGGEARQLGRGHRLRPLRPGRGTRGQGLEPRRRGRGSTGRYLRPGWTARPPTAGLRSRPS